MFRLSVNIIYVLLSFSLVFSAVDFCIAIWILRWSHRQINRSRRIEIMSINEKIIILIHYSRRGRPFRTGILLFTLYRWRPGCSPCLYRRSSIQMNVLILSFVGVLLFFLFRKFSKIVNGIMIIITNFILSFLFKCAHLIISFALLTPITIVFLLAVIIIWKFTHVFFIRFLIAGWFLLIYRGLGSVTFKITLKPGLILLHILGITNICFI
jgi:hypothetical protein